MKDVIKHAAESSKHFIDVGKHLAEAAASSPSTAWFVLPIVWLQAWWYEWASALTDALTSFLGLVLLVVLIRFHLHKTNNLIQQTKKMKKDNKSEEDE